MRWTVVALSVLAVFALASLLNRKTATAAPQAAAPAKTSASNGAAQSGAISIPDTTLAVNSPTPMSQRIVHYEIDAKYDAAK